MYKGVATYGTSRVARLINLVLCILATAALAASCATMASVKPGAGTVFTVDNKSYDEVWRVSLSVVERSLDPVEVDKDAGLIKAKEGVGLMTWGSVVGVFVTPKDNPIQVEVVSFKRARMQITGEDWGPRLVSEIQAELR